MTVEQIRAAIENKPARSAWEKGVKVYAAELLDSLQENIDGGYIKMPESRAELKEALLNGAKDWNQYSWGGCSLCYDCQIAERLCSPSELKKTRNGERRPNCREEWLDTQARALNQAFRLIYITMF